MPADTPAPAAADRKKREIKPVTPLDPSKPIYGILYQTPTREVTTFFQGPNAAEEAQKEAKRLAKAARRPVTVFGPQIAAYAPPAEDVASVPLNFEG